MRQRAVFALVPTFLVWGCHGTQEGNPGGPPANGAGAPEEQVAVYITGLDTSVDSRPLDGLAAVGRRLQALPSTFQEAAAPCVPPKLGGAPTPGVCLTPVNLKGWAEKVHLTGTRRDAKVDANGIPEPSRCGGGRLLAVNATSDVGEVKRGGGAFDLQDPKPVGGNTSLDCEEYPTTDWNTVSIHFVYLDAQVLGPSSVLNMRFVFEANPLREEPVFNEPACTLQDSRINDWLYLPADVKVQRGDVLVCEKASADETCTDAEYQWVDTSTKTLSSTRPTSAYQLDYIRKYRTGKDENGQVLDVFCETNCERNSPHCGYSGGGYDVDFRFAAPDVFNLYSELITDRDPRHPHYDADVATGAPAASGEREGHPPVFWYTHRTQDGATTEGSGRDMSIVLRLDTAQFLFVEDVADVAQLEALSAGELAARVTLTDMFSRGEPTNYGHQSTLSGKVEVAFTSTP